MDKKLTGSLVVIFILLTFGWAGLWFRMHARTSEALKEQYPAVETIWGKSLSQPSPEVVCKELNKLIEPEETKIDIEIKLDYRRRGMVYFTTYAARFTGEYLIKNPRVAQSSISFKFPLPGEVVMLQDFHIFADGVEASKAEFLSTGVIWSGTIGPGAAKTVKVSYLGRGLDRFTYQLPHNRRQKSFQCKMRILGAKEIDFPLACMSPHMRQELADGWQLGWELKDFMTSFDIGIILPSKVSPSRQLERLCIFAPFFFILFLFGLLGISKLENRTLEPLPVVLVSAAYFMFYLLLAYLSGYLNLNHSFAISFLVACFLIVNHLRAHLGAKIALGYCFPLILFLIGLFPFATTMPRYTGLIISIGAIILLGIVMQITTQYRLRSSG